MSMLGRHRTHFHFARSLRRYGRVVALSIALVIAQLGIATHSLHLDAKDGQKVELTCAFCIAGSHFGAAPSTFVVAATRSPDHLVVVRTADVCDAQPLVTSRLTRGPPLFFV